MRAEVTTIACEEDAKTMLLFRLREDAFDIRDGPIAYRWQLVLVLVSRPH